MDRICRSVFKHFSSPSTCFEIGGSGRARRRRWCIAFTCFFQGFQTDTTYTSVSNTLQNTALNLSAENTVTSRCTKAGKHELKQLLLLAKMGELFCFATDSQFLINQSTPIRHVMTTNMLTKLSMQKAVFCRLIMHVVQLCLIVNN